MGTSDYSLGSYLGPEMMASIKGMGASASGTATQAQPAAGKAAPTQTFSGGGSSGSATAAAGPDYQAIFDGAVTDPTQLTPGKGGYLKSAGPAGSYILNPQGKAGAPAYQVTSDGKVFSRPVKPGSDFSPVAPAGTVDTGVPAL